MGSASSSHRGSASAPAAAAQPRPSQTKSHYADLMAALASPNWNDRSINDLPSMIVDDPNMIANTQSSLTPGTPPPLGLPAVLLANRPPDYHDVPDPPLVSFATNLMRQQSSAGDYHSSSSSRRMQNNSLTDARHASTSSRRTREYHGGRSRTSRMGSAEPHMKDEQPLTISRSNRSTHSHFNRSTHSRHNRSITDDSSAAMGRQPLVGFQSNRSSLNVGGGAEGHSSHNRHTYSSNNNNQNAGRNDPFQLPLLEENNSNDNISASARGQRKQFGMSHSSAALYGSRTSRQGGLRF